MTWPLVALLAALTQPAEGAVQVRLAADRATVGMGRTVRVTTTATNPSGRPAPGVRLMTYVNGKRWGAPEATDASGHARFDLPMPNPGPAEITAAILPSEASAPERWIWAATTGDHQEVWLQKSFTAGRQVGAGSFYIGADDAAEVWLNGKRIWNSGGWTETPRIAIPAGMVQVGANTLSIKATNGTGPAGLIARLTWRERTGTRLVASGASWQVFAAKPADWPGACTGGAAASLYGTAFQSGWSLSTWPTAAAGSQRFAGAPMPAGATLSNRVRVDVIRRQLVQMPADSKHLVGLQWEPWFTPRNAAWSTAQAVPVMGFYWSWNPDVTRQHMLWFAESGIDFLVIDWTNHLWDKKAWDERPDATNEIIHSTTLALETLATLRDEGIRVPKVVFLTGLTNGPSTTMHALNEEHAWIYHNYVRNPRFADLWVLVEGKPLILPFNGGGPRWLAANSDEPLDTTHFTARWCSAQHQGSHDNEAGYWSWMDGSLRQPITLKDGTPEAMTVSTAFFAGGGWTAPTAYGRRNGSTYVESWRRALETHPGFVQLHQFQEYAGQPEGQGYGPNHDQYVDTYSVELSDDIEPVSMTAPAYRGNGGWGYLYLNLTRALVDLYKQPKPITTVVAIETPLGGSLVAGPSINLAWTWVGKRPTGWIVAIDGRQVGRLPSTATRTALPLGGLRPGRHVVRVTAQGTLCRYLPLTGSDALPEARPAAAYSEIVITR